MHPTICLKIYISILPGLYLIIRFSTWAKIRFNKKEKGPMQKNSSIVASDLIPQKITKSVLRSCALMVYNKHRTIDLRLVIFEEWTQSFQARGPLMFIPGFLKGLPVPKRVRMPSRYAMIYWYVFPEGQFILIIVIVWKAFFQVRSDMSFTLCHSQIDQFRVCEVRKDNIFKNYTTRWYIILVCVVLNA